METLNVAALRESITNITRILSGKGITVTQRGSRAYVESHKKTGVPLRVNLPYIPDTATRPLIDAINGFLDHEVGHLLFTDFKVVGKANKMGKVIASLHNIVEDTYEERKMSARFKGSAANLENVGKFFLEKHTDPNLIKALANNDENDVISLLMVPAIRAWAGQQIFIDYMKDKWEHLESVTSKIDESIIEQIEAVDSSEDALEAALSIHKALTKDEPPCEGGDEEKDDKEGSGEGEGSGENPGEPDDSEDPSDGDESDSDGGDDGKEKDGTDDGDHSGDEMSDSSPEGEEPDNDEDASKSKSKPEEEDEEDESEDEDETSAPSEPEDEDEGESEDEDEEDEEPTPEEKLEEIMKDVDFDDSVAEMITEDSADATRSAEYSIYSNEWDVIEPPKIDKSFDQRWVEEMEDQTKQMVGTLQKNLERLVIAQKQSRWNSGLHRGKVNSSSLYRLKTGDTRVFRKRQIIGETKDVAMSLVCDNSGSMSGEPVKLAMVAAYAMSSVLDRLGVVHEVSGFTTLMPEATMLSEIHEEERRLGIKFSRYEPLYIPILKGFDERLGVEQRRRIAWTSKKCPLRNNIDGESIQVASDRLLKRPEFGKIMFVLSDGNPAGMGDYHAQARHLGNMVKFYTKCGIKMVGIGIQDDSVSEYYENYVVLHKLEDLPNQIMKELRKVILR